MSRNHRATHQELADQLWLHAARQLDIRVVRSADAYASWDGQGTLTLASDEFLDPDDCLAQMLLHEICHLLVSGEEARGKPDWGLDNTSPKDLVYEYATNRLQAALSGAYGLRQFMGVTTMWRPYYDALPRDPLQPQDPDPAVVLARTGLALARRSPYREVLHEALSGTAALAAELRPAVYDDSLWQLVPGKHPTGFHNHVNKGYTCGSCAWAITRKDKRIACRMTRQGCRPSNYCLGQDTDVQEVKRLDAAQSACEFFEQVFDDQECPSCGACCRQGFDVVEVAANERFAQVHPDLIEVREAGRQVVPRPQGRCIALQGTGTSDAPWLCRHYADRPQACRAFAVAGDACLVARQRVNIS